MLELIGDDGWDDELAGSASKGYQHLRERLINKGLVAYSRGNTYVYLIASNKWSVFISADVQRQLCDLTGSESATVNYLNASMPYFAFLQKHALRTAAIPLSICIGTRRLGVSMKDDILTFTECRSVASIDEKLDTRIEGFCVMPMSFKELPTSWSPGGNQRINKYLKVLFNDPIEFETIKWLIGMAAVDPASVSKFLLLYGPGGTGKSTLIRVIESVFDGCCGTISSGTLTDKRPNINADTARSIASNRVITA